MVSPDQEEIFRISDFITEQKEDGFEGHFSPIDIISQKQIVWIGRKPTQPEQLHQIKKLPMNVANNVDGRCEFEDNRLFQEYLFGLVADGLDLILGKLDFLFSLDPV